MRALARRLRADAGISLIEVLVSVMLTAVVSTLVLGGVVQSSRMLRHDEDEQRGLADAKAIMDRLGRDVRESRSVVCDGGLANPTDPTSADPGCNSHLQLWVDDNSDYVKQDSEVITWRLKKSADGEHFDVWRVTGTGVVPVSERRQATSLWTNLAFTYTPAPTTPGNLSAVTQVDINIGYDAIVGAGAEDRTAKFSARLRNKGA